MTSYSKNPGNIAIQVADRLRYQDTLPVSFEYGFNSSAHVSRIGESTFTDFVSILLAGAASAREKAVSHRGFKVGAAALVIYQRNGLLSHQILHGANVKPTSDDAVNVHAEHTFLTKAQNYADIHNASVTIPMFAVVAIPQPDKQSGVQTRTLHPCGICRNAFNEPGSPVGPNSISITASPDFSVRECFKVSDLDRIHNGGAYEIPADTYDTSSLLSDSIDYLSVLRTGIAQTLIRI